MASEAPECNSLTQKQTGKRARSTNCNVNETLKLEELVKENFEVLNSKFTNQVTNNIKTEIWKNISKQVSALGYAHRTEQACIEKWANLKRKAKKEITKEKMERRKTGGGPSFEASQQSQRIGDMLSKTSAFSGIQGGLDSDEQDGLHYVSNKTCEVPQEPNTHKKMPPLTIQSPNTCVDENRIVGTCIPGVSNTSNTASSSNYLKRVSQNRLSTRKRAKRSKSEILMDYQIAYIKGMVERQDLEKELVEVKLRVLKAAESKMDDLNARELLNLLTVMYYIVDFYLHSFCLIIFRNVLNLNIINTYSFRTFFYSITILF